jgi:hypothetical protein
VLGVVLAVSEEEEGLEDDALLTLLVVNAF